MFIRMRDSHPRSVVKALSWRIVGSSDTFVLSFNFTRSLQLAGSISVTEMFTKMMLSYFQERLWAAIPLCVLKTRSERTGDEVRQE